MIAINCEMEKNRKWNRLETAILKCRLLRLLHYLFHVHTYRETLSLLLTLAPSLSCTSILCISSYECAAASCYYGSGGGDDGGAIIQSYSMYVNHLYKMLHLYSMVNKFTHVFVFVSRPNCCVSHFMPSTILIVERKESIEQMWTKLAAINGVQSQSNGNEIESWPNRHTCTYSNIYIRWLSQTKQKWRQSESKKTSNETELICKTELIWTNCRHRTLSFCAFKLTIDLCVLCSYVACVYTNRAYASREN